MAWLTEHWFIEAVLIIASGLVVAVILAWLYNQINKDI